MATVQENGFRLRVTLFGSASLVLTAISILALMEPLLPLNDPTAFVSNEPFAPPSAQYWLGTDYLGRDLLARLFESSRITLGMALIATVLAHLIGNTLGLIAALRSGWLDSLLSRIVDVVLSIPKIIAGLVILAAVGPSITAIVCLTAIVYAAGVFRIARALAKDLVSQDFVIVAQARGEGPAWILFGEILPHVISPLATDFALRMSFAILFISSLSFLGLGVQPPMADWGGLARENLDSLHIGSLAAVYPAVAIAITAIALNLFIDGLAEREAGGRGE